MLRPLLVLLMLLAAAPAAAKTKLAVMALGDQTRTLEGTLLESLTDALRTQLAQSGEFIVIDKSRQAAALKKLVAEQKKESYKSCYDSRCQIPLGQALAADSILRTKLTRVGSYYLLNAELVDLEKEAMTSAAQARVSFAPRAGRDDRLLLAVSAVARQLSRGSGSAGSAGGAAGAVAPIVDATPVPTPYDRTFSATPTETPEELAARTERERTARDEALQRMAQLRGAADARAQQDQARRRRLNYLGYGWLGIITGGLTAISGVAYLTVKVSSAQQEAAQASSSSDLEAANGRARDARNTGIITTALGGTLLGVGALLVILAPKVPQVPVQALPAVELRRSGFAMTYGKRF